MRFIRWVFVLLLLPFALSADWMTEQIQEDLAPFRKTGIHRSQLLQEMQRDDADELCLRLVEITNNKVSVTGGSSACPNRADYLIAFLEQLTSRYRLPDVAFIISLHDSYENTGLFAKPVSSIPVFTFAKDAKAKSILFPDFEVFFFSDNLIACSDGWSMKYPWGIKSPMIFWRGSTSGGLEFGNHLDRPRMKLVLLSEKNPGWVDAGFSGICQVGALGNSLQEYYKPCVDIPAHYYYKYLIDIDGNSCTYSRCRWILLSNSTLIKPKSNNIQWYYKALRPYEHYVPCREDLGDLEEVYNWLYKNDKEACRIALTGQALGRTLFSSTAVALYVKILLQEYAKLYLPK